MIKKSLIVTIAIAILYSISAYGTSQSPNIKFVDASTFPLYGKVDEHSLARYERLPEHYQDVLRPPLWYFSRQSAGLSIRFRTNSTSIHAKWVSTFKCYIGHMADTGTRGLDLYALDNGKWRHVCCADPSETDSNNTTNIISGMTHEYREYMLYLSLYDGIVSLEIGIDPDAEITAPHINSPTREKPIVMYGTSILQGGCASRPGMAHTNMISRALDKEVINLGFSGNALMDLEIAEYMAQTKDPGVFVLDYVPNASAALIDSLGVPFFDILRKKHPNVPVIFVEDPTFPKALFSPILEEQITSKNSAQKRLYEKLIARGEKGLYYVDTENLIGEDGDGTVDGIHFTDLGSARYVEKLLPTIKKALSVESFKTENCHVGMPIHATFLDEISWDIPHQNWGPEEWDKDFKAMKQMGINTVVLIRSGLGKWISAPFDCILKSEDVYYPPLDLVEMFLTLSDKYDMSFYFGLYDSGKYWHIGEFQKEIDLNLKLIDEVWNKYGHHKSFQGWYLSQEVSRRTKNMSKIYAELGKYAKKVSGNLPVLVSPYIHGIKTDQCIAGDKPLSVQEHENEWNEILSNIQGAVDILAFQDGQVDYHELYDYLVVNKKLADRYGMRCWTNIESFDRDMPIRFLPIKWEKLLYKLDMARKAGMEDAITFEFSHFMSPNSSYTQAGHLYQRYMEHFGLK